jgi:uncharacterized protein YegJ (DUF2314 family)
MILAGAGGEMVRLYFACMLFAVATAAQAAQLTEQSCSVIASKADEKPVLQEVPGLSVLSLRPDHPLGMHAADGVTIRGIACWRSEARLAENDYLVSDEGLPLYIKTEFEDESRNRTLILERTNGGFRARLLNGPELSADEKSEVEKFLALYEARVLAYAATPASSAPLASNAPADQPLPVTAGKRNAYEQAIAAYVAQAKQTWPDAKRRYLAGLPARQVFFVTTQLRDGQGRYEVAFIRVRSIKGGVISGIISSEMQLVRTHKMGESYSFREEDLLDWMIANPDGSEEGNVVGKFLDTYQR